MTYMQKWVQGLGNRQREVLDRLTKDAVRNHRNIRLAGEGGASSAEGSFAQNAGHQAQHDIQGYVSQIPVVGSAANFLGGLSSPGGGQGHGGQSHGGGLMANMSTMGGMMGEVQGLMSQSGGGGPGRREVDEHGYPGAGSGYPSGTMSNPPVPPSNIAYSSYSTYQEQSTYPSEPSGYQSHHHESSYSSPPQQSYGGTPSFPGESSYASGHPSHSGHSGYTPSYNPSYAPPEPDTSAPGFPGYGGSYAPPPGPPGFPGPSPGFPGADAPGAPGFPGADQYGGGFGYKDAPQNRRFNDGW